jgi:hypothetical protein
MTESAAPSTASLEWFTRARLLALLGLFVVIAFPGQVAGTHSFFYRDFGLFGYPVAHFARESFWRGEIPFWNPLNNCGLPFMAQWNTMVFYPGALLYLLAPLPWALNYFCLLHLFLAAAGMYSLAEAWTKNRFAASVAGLVFAFNGLTLHTLMWPNNIAALAWMPWVVLTAQRAYREGGNRVVLAILAGALQLFTGAPEVILLTWLTVGALWLGDLAMGEIPRSQTFVRLLLCGIMAAAIAAVQLLPFLELLRESRRSAGYSDAYWSMPLWGVVNFFVPLFGCTPSQLGVYSQDAQQWTSSYYVGIGALALAVIGARFRGPARVLSVLAVLGIIFAMGDAAFVYLGLKKLLPVLGYERFPVKWLILTVFAVPLLAAFGIDRLDQLKYRKGLLLGIGTAFGAIIAGALIVSFLRPIGGASPTTTLASGFSRLVFLAVTLMLAGYSGANVRRETFLRLGLLLVVGTDALTHAPRQNPPVSTIAYAPIQFPMTSLPVMGESRAMIAAPMQLIMQGAATADPVEAYLGYRRALFANCNLPDNVPQVYGFFSMYVRDTEAVIAHLYKYTVPPEPLLEFLGVSRISDPQTLFVWHNRTNYLPLVTAGQRPIVMTTSNAMAGIFSNQFDPRRQVYLSPEADSAVKGLNFANAQIVSSKVEHERISAVVEAAGTAVVVIAQAFYPAWKASLDGNPVQLLKANCGFQAVVVPAGRHQLTIQYQDRMFLTGAVISTLSLLATALLFCWQRWKNPKAGSMSSLACN